MFRSLLAAAMMLAVSVLPSLANDADKGVAGVMVVYSLCGKELVPPNVLSLINVYLKTRNEQVMTEAKDLMDQLSSIPNMDKETAKNLWCEIIKPKLPAMFSGM